jgi:RNA polymerase sigma factor (TIGR02999 family)
MVSSERPTANGSRIFSPQPTLRKNVRQRINKKSQRALAMALPPSDPNTPQRDVTTLLNLLGQRDRQVAEELYRLVEGELRKTAEAYIARERPLYSLEPTLLIDDAFLKLTGGQQISWDNRAHFYRLAARVMRQIIVDNIRKEGCLKRDRGQRPISLGQEEEPVDRKWSALERQRDLHEALDRLEATDPELFEVVQLHHFGGRTFEEAARILSISVPTAKRYWKTALAFLHRDLAPREGPAH